MIILAIIISVIEEKRLLGDTFFIVIYILLITRLRTPNPAYKTYYGRGSSWDVACLDHVMKSRKNQPSKHSYRAWIIVRKNMMMDRKEINSTEFIGALQLVSVYAAGTIERTKAIPKANGCISVTSRWSALRHLDMEITILFDNLL